MTLAPEAPVSTELEAPPAERGVSANPATWERWPSPMMIAALASIGAGGIHAAAVGAHGDHRFLATLFVWLAAFQICWGIAMLLRPTRALTVLGLFGNAAAATFWLLTRLRGISFIDGLEVREEIQFADAVGAGLAVLVVGIALGTLLSPDRTPEHRLTNLSVAGFLVAALTLPAMVTVGTHQHTTSATDGSATDGHDHSAAVVDTSNTAVPAAHSHDTTAPAPSPTAAPVQNSTNASSSPSTVPATTEAPSAVPPTPYDPTKPLDFSGVDGVTPEEQARAENLVAITLARLPQFADPEVADSRGWHSIGDGLTGYEHYINPATLADGRELDPDYPESLVYKLNRDGSKTLVSVMFMAEPGVTLDTVPDIGGTLTQWHIHNNLCFTADPVAPRVAGITSAGGDCNAPLVKGPETPMIHVWIVPHPCGPFAALEGIAAGQVKDGEARWCDHVHGSGG